MSTFHKSKIHCCKNALNFSVVAQVALGPSTEIKQLQTTVSLCVPRLRNSINLRVDTPYCPSFLPIRPSLGCQMEGLDHPISQILEPWLHCHYERKKIKDENEDKESFMRTFSPPHVFLLVSEYWCNKKNKQLIPPPFLPNMSLSSWNHQAILIFHRSCLFVCFLF